MCLVTLVFGEAAVSCQECKKKGLITKASQHLTEDVC